MPIVVLNLIKSQGEHFGFDLPEDFGCDTKEPNGEIMETGDILWFSNVQMLGEEVEINSPTVVEFSKEMAMAKISEHRKKWNATVTMTLQSTDMIVNDCICSKINKYKCSCFGDRKPMVPAG